MGQAKNRGTREERVAQAIVKQKVEAERLKKLREEREAAMTPEEKEERRKAAESLATLITAAGMFGGHSIL